jgi:hypothetical protein
LASRSEATIFNCSFAAYSHNSRSGASIGRIWRSSCSVDLRQYTMTSIVAGYQIYRGRAV